VSGEHTGLFTALSVTGTPGQIHSFLAKDAADAWPHTGIFTELSVMALPGVRRSFAPKTVVASSGVRRLKYHYPEDTRYMLARRADEDFIEVLALILPKILQ